MAVVGVRGGVHDAYVPDETALLVERSEASLLADAIEQLLKNHARAQALAEGAIAHMKKHHTMSAMAEKTGAVYREMALHRATFPLPRRSG
jgi:glycosyltransferase involved in cell wall biosynthesis